MNNLQVFNYHTKNVRSLVINHEPWFVLRDVCEVLELSNSRMVADRLDPDEKDVSQIDTLGGKQEMAIINESGLYNVILRSDKLEARTFRKWITSEVLPSIRRHGMYATDDLLNDPDLAIKAFTALKEERARRVALEAEKAVLQPKAEFFDAVAESKDAIDIGSAAKVLNMGIGRNNLFDFLREQEILMNNNQPYQRFVDAGYFRTVEQKYQKPDGSTCISIKTLVYQKGLNYIRKQVKTHYRERASLSG